MFKVNNKDTRMSFNCIYCQLWTRSTSFPSVSAVDFEQLNICWVPHYQFINAEITHCCNYRQMYKNLSEIAAHKKRPGLKQLFLKKTFFPCKLQCLIAGNSFLRVKCFFISQKQLRHSIPQCIGRYFLEERLQP